MIRQKSSRLIVAAAAVSLWAATGCNACADPVIQPGRDMGVSDASNGPDDTASAPDSGTAPDMAEADACAAACNGDCCGDGEDCVDGACVAACAEGPRCATEAGSVCCSADEGCAFEKCVDLGPACDDNNPCPFTHFCEPTLGRCIDFGEDPNACLFVPPVGTFNPVEAFKWDASSNAPTYDQVMMMPVVANLTDDNGDGRIDVSDIPDILFTTFAGSAYNDPGVLRVISGDGSGEHWSSTTLPVPFDVYGSATPAVGDIDGDGIVEIIVDGGSAGGVYAIEHDGTIKWHQPAGRGTRFSSVAIANLDGAGLPEIVARGQVLSAAGDVVCQLSSSSITPVVADLDVDGTPEILMGRAIARLANPAATDGTGCTEDITSGEAYPAVANFDDDPQAEVVYAQDGNLVLVDHDGTELWNQPLPVDDARILADFGVADCNAAPAGQACADDAACGGGPARCIGGTCVPHSYCRPGGGPPTIADFDGDRQPEIAIAGRWYYLVFEADGSVLWAHKTQDFSSAVTGSSVFDFEGDGRAEVVYNDERYLRVYRGSGKGVDEDGDGFADADILLEVENSSGTLAEYPLIVDVDRDGSAEIVVAANNYSTAGSITHGIRVFKDAENRWVGTRPIWNQHSYHVTNVEEDGTIPLVETNNWSVTWLNNYRQNSQGGNPFTAPNLTATVDSVDALACTTSGVDIAFTIRNQGSLGVRVGALSATLYIAAAGQDFAPVTTVQNTQPLGPGATETFTYTWTAPTAVAGQRFDVKVVADDDGTGVGEHNECVEDDNEGRLDNTLCAVPQ